MKYLLLFLLLPILLMGQKPLKTARHFYVVVDTGKCRCSTTYTVTDGSHVNEKLILKDCACDGTKQIVFMYEFKSYEDYQNFIK